MTTSRKLARDAWSRDQHIQCLKLVMGPIVRQCLLQERNLEKRRRTAKLSEVRRQWVPPCGVKLRGHVVCLCVSAVLVTTLMGRLPQLAFRRRLNSAGPPAEATFEQTNVH